MTDYLVTDYGAVGDGKTLCTDAIRRAIDDCAANGGRVVIPAGEYLSGSLLLLSGVEFHLDRDAVLIASTDPSDHCDFSAGFEDDNPDTGWEGGCFLRAAHAEHIVISGHGVIDGQGRAYFYDDDDDGGFHEAPLAVRGLRPRLSFFEDVTDFEIRDVTFRDAAFWTLHLAGCRDVRIEGIRILNNERGANNDGIDPDCCRNVTIRGCEIRTGDDCVVIKTTAPMTRKYRECSDIHISDCSFTSRSSAIKIGTETWGSIRNIRVENCELKDCNRGIGIWSRDGGGIEGLLFQNIHGNTRVFAECLTRRTGVYLWWGKGDAVMISATKRAGADRLPGGIRDVTFDRMEIACEGMSVIAGEPYAPVSDVRFSDSKLIFRRQSPHRPKYLDEMPSERGRREMALSALYLRSADPDTSGLTLAVEEDMRAFIREGIRREEAS